MRSLLIYSEARSLLTDHPRKNEKRIRLKTVYSAYTRFRPGVV